MKIDEVIEKLNEIKKEEGNIDVTIDTSTITPNQFTSKAIIPIKEIVMVADIHSHKAIINYYY